MNEDAKNEAFQHKWNYACTSCGATWQMTYYDLLNLTEQPIMPCGCDWQYLSMVNREQEI